MALGSEAQKRNITNAFLYRKGNSKMQRLTTEGVYKSDNEVIYAKMYKEHIALNKKKNHIIYIKKVRGLKQTLCWRRHNQWFVSLENGLNLNNHQEKGNQSLILARMAIIKKLKK